MNLLVDIGNTLTKIAVSDGKSILTEFKLRSIDLDFIKDTIEDNNIKNSAVTPYCIPIHLWSCENTYLVQKLSW